MIRLFAKFRWYDWLIIAILVGVSIVQAYFTVFMPRESAVLFERMLDGSPESQLWQAGGRTLMYAGGGLIANLFGSVIAAYLASSLGRRVRNDLFEKVQSFGFEEMNKFSTASLITRATNDITQAQMVMMMTLRIAISSPIIAIWAIMRINAASPGLTMMTAISIVGMIVVMSLMAMLVLPKFQMIQKLTDRLNGVTRQNLTGLRVVKAYSAEEFEQKKFHDVNYRLNRTNVFANSIMGLTMPLIMLVMNGVNLAIFWLGAHLINQGTLNFPDLMEFSTLIMQVLMAFIMIAMLLVFVPRAQVSAKRVMEVLGTKVKVTDPLEPKEFDNKNTGEIVFDNVSFRYPSAEESVLEGVSFKVAKGETAAFIGSTGSGKSTLINLVPRFYDVSGGAVYVDGRDVREVRQKDLRARIGYVPQKGVLFGGTVESNINYGNAETKEQNIKEAAYVAMADEFISNLEDGYNANVSQGGKNFSGGQRQRMAIARAAAVRPDIFVFDDSFSALDYKTDKEVRKRLKQYTSGATCLIVAQRIGTIMDADIIVVLDKGTVVGIGTHKELLKSCDVYKEIAFSQLSEEELENDK